MQLPVPLQSTVLEQAFSGFVTQVVDALPAILAGVVFLAVAAVVVTGIITVVHHVLVRTVPEESVVYRQFVETGVAVFLWFSVALTFLSVVGMNQLAAALGTATGFGALGVAYALSAMIEDVVAGVYLLRDPDFTPGDTVTAGDMTGEVRSIELRKTRFDVDGDVVVRANADVEKRWTKRGG
jgi:small-conductance mechanosensitive channel